MELIFNELSIHGQFHDIAAFRDAIGRVMSIRQIARRFGRELQCHRNVVNVNIAPDTAMPAAVGRLNIESRRALMQWLTHYGPFWEDARQHGDDDWLEYNGKIVTDTAVGEAAYCLFYAIDRALVSMNPSSWLLSHLTVDWYENGYVRSVDVPNYWDADQLTEALASSPAPLETWEDLAVVARSRYPDLTFSADSFEPLRGHPFGRGTANRLLSRLATLHELKSRFDNRGARTPEGHSIYEKHFTGDKAWFSDSSDSEKSAFRNSLMFPHPAKPGEFLFCTWHGKVRTPQLRIHFSWPIQAGEPLYVVYVGPKITKR